MKGIIFAATLLNFLIASASQADSISWEKDFEVAQKKAQDTGKLLLIDFFHPQ